MYLLVLWNSLEISIREIEKIICFKSVWIDFCFFLFLSDSNLILLLKLIYKFYCSFMCIFSLSWNIEQKEYILDFGDKNNFIKFLRR